MSTPSAPSYDESDPERTAELPVLDPTAYAAAAERNLSRTDTWISPAPSARAAQAPAAAIEAPPPAAAPRPAEPGAQALSAALRETQALLAGKAERTAQLKRARDQAQAAQAAAEQRASELKDELEQLRAEHAFQLDEHAHARAQFDEQLAQARALVSAAGARTEELRRQLEEHERATRARGAREGERQESRATDRVHAASVMDELHLERARSFSFFESLQSAEARRLILEGLLTDLQREAQERKGELGHVARELIGRDARGRELDAELAQRAARIGRLEQQVTSFAAALAQRDAQLRESRHEAQGLQDSVAALRAQLSASSERMRTLQALAQQHSSSDSQQQSELTRLQAERASLSAAVESARAATVAATAQAGAHEAALAQVGSRNAELESALIAERRRVGQLEDELAGLRGERNDWDAALKKAHEERNASLASIAAAEARVKELEERAAEQFEVMRVLRADTNASVARARELEADLRAAEDTVHRLESEARARNARLEELEKASSHWRATLEEARHTATDTAATPALRDAVRHVGDAEPPAPPEPVPDGATRLLIHTAEGREVVHVLGRKTSIGRTPDNDLQIDAKYVSRHHAVILVGPVYTIIEDLNSTNGVQVNGRRITRQTLKDGDTVLIGRAQYRFGVRRVGEKR